MKTITIQFLIIPILFFNFSLAQDITPSNVKSIMQKVADWQIENHGDVKFRAQNKRLKSTRHHPLDWTNGALYVGMVKWAAMAEEDKYFNWLKDIAEEHDWKLHARTYHADDHTVGQMYI